MWHLLYDKDSSRDISTLYAEKNFLHATKVQDDPMKDVDATIDFLTEYTKAMILAALEELIQQQKVTANHLPLQEETAMNDILDLMIDNAFPAIHSQSVPFTLSLKMKIYTSTSTASRASKKWQPCENT